MPTFQQFSHIAYAILPIATLFVMTLTIGARVIRLFTSVPVKAWAVLLFLGAVIWFVASGAGYIP